MHQFLANWSSTYLEESLAATAAEVAEIDVSAGDLDGELDWYLGHLTGCMDFGS